MMNQENKDKLYWVEKANEAIDKNNDLNIAINGFKKIDKELDRTNYGYWTLELLHDSIKQILYKLENKQK